MFDDVAHDENVNPAAPRGDAAHGRRIDPVLHRFDVGGGGRDAEIRRHVDPPGRRDAGVTQTFEQVVVVIGQSGRCPTAREIRQGAEALDDSVEMVLRFPGADQDRRHEGVVRHRLHQLDGPAVPRPRTATCRPGRPSVLLSLAEGSYYCIYWQLPSMSPLRVTGGLDRGNGGKLVGSAKMRGISRRGGGWSPG